MIVCGNTCTDINSDINNCGDCQVNCDQTFGQCVDGVCGCLFGMTPCFWNNRCFDLSLDPENCGDCNNNCGGREYCIDGQCVCRPGFSECNGNCVDINSNVFHCGDCNSPCWGSGNGDMCYQGQCTFTDCDQQDPPADFCDPGGSSCVLEQDFDTNPLHCGGCNSDCAEDEVCVQGSCEQFDVGRGCSDCPCDDCAGNEQCCIYPGTSDVICVQGTNNCP